MTRTCYDTYLSLVMIIVNELGDDFYSKYNDSATVDAIANKVEMNLNSIKAVYSNIDQTLTEVASILCNG